MSRARAVHRRPLTDPTDGRPRSQRRETHRDRGTTVWLGDVPLCTVLRLDDWRFLWILLVLRREDMDEIDEMEQSDRAQLMEEIARTSKALKDRWAPFRLNIADIGNRAYQLHNHIVCRFEDDPFWPQTVWSLEREPYDEKAKAARQTEMIEAFGYVPGFVASKARF